MNNQFPKITIVTPNYNQGAYIEDTIMSILGQGYPNLEYIIIDGGSTDNSLEIIKKYETQLAYWVSEPDNGMYDAIQKGFKKSSGEIMGWINSDDMHHRKSLFTIAEIFTKFDQVNWLIGFPTLFDIQGRIVESQRSTRYWSRFDLYTGRYKWIQQESVFWRRSLWQIAGGTLDTSLRYAGDFELWNRFFKFDKLYATTALLSGFRMRDGEQLSSKQRDAYEREIQQVLDLNIVNDDDNKVVNGFFRLFKIHLLLSKFKIFNTDNMLIKYKTKYFEYPPVIQYNKQKGGFEMNL